MTQWRRATRLLRSGGVFLARGFGRTPNDDPNIIHGHKVDVEMATLMLITGWAAGQTASG